MSDSIEDKEVESVDVLNPVHAVVPSEDAPIRTLNTGDCLDLSMQRVVNSSLKLKMDFGDCFIGLEKVVGVVFIVQYLCQMFVCYRQRQFIFRTQAIASWMCASIEQLGLTACMRFVRFIFSKFINNFMIS